MYSLFSKSEVRNCNHWIYLYEDINWLIDASQVQKALLRQFTRTRRVDWKRWEACSTPRELLVLQFVVRHLRTPSSGCTVVTSRNRCLVVGG